MTIEYSAQGLSNVHILNSCDAVLYCEAGSGSETNKGRSFDQAYWAMLCNVHMPTRKITVLARGPKSQLLPIVAEVAANGVRTVGVAFDRDFDLGYDSQKPYIMMTYGRALESDVFAIRSFRRVISRLCPMPGTDSAATAATKALTKFMSDARWLTLVESTFQENGLSLFDNGGHAQFLTAAKYPRFNKSRALSVMRSGKAGLTRRVSRNAAWQHWQQRQVNAKLLWIAVHRALRAVSTRLNQKISIGSAELLALMIELREAPESEYEVNRLQYYEWMFRRFREWIG